MKIKANEQGLLIPLDWLGGMNEAEISRENGHIVVVPLAKIEDPIHSLGRQPLNLDVTDASINHDQHLYQP